MQAPIQALFSPPLGHLLNVSTRASLVHGLAAPTCKFLIRKQSFLPRDVHDLLHSKIRVALKRFFRVTAPRPHTPPVRTKTSLYPYKIAYILLPYSVHSYQTKPEASKKHRLLFDKKEKPKAPRLGYFTYAMRNARTN